MARHPHAADIDGHGAVTQGLSRGNAASQHQRTRSRLAYVMSCCLCFKIGCSIEADPDTSNTAPTTTGVMHEAGVQADRKDTSPVAPEDVLRELHAQGELFLYRQTWVRGLPLQVEIPSWWTLSKINVGGELPEQISVLDCGDNELLNREAEGQWFASIRPFVRHYYDSHRRELVEIPFDCMTEEVSQVFVRIDSSAGEVLAFALPVTLVNSVEDILSLHEDEAYSKRLYEALSRFHFWWNEDGTQGSIMIRIPTPADVETAIALDIELRVDGELFHMAHFLCGRATNSSGTASRNGYVWIKLDVLGEYKQAREQLRDGGTLTVTLRSNPELALRDYRAKSVWVGDDIEFKMYQQNPQLWWSALRQEMDESGQQQEM